MNIEWGLVLTALFTSSLGSIVRMAHDSETDSISLRKALLVYVCSLSTGYVCYELSLNYGKTWFVGVPSLLLSLASVEITNVFINSLGFVFDEVLKALPDVIIEAGRRALNLPPRDKNKRNNDPNDSIE